MEQDKTQVVSVSHRLPLRHTFLLLALLCLIWFGTETARADGQIESGGKTGVVGVGVPYSAVLETAKGADVTFIRDQRLSIDPTVKFGPSRLNLDFGTAEATAQAIRIPWLKRGAPPEEAKLKIGNLYGNVDRVTLEGLWTDNANREENRRKSGYITVAKAPVEAVLQLNDGLRLDISGEVIVLPSEGKAGLVGFGLRDPLELEARWDPVFDSTLRSEFELGGWDMAFTDSFEVVDWANRTQARARVWRQLQLIREQQFDESDEIGRYSYGPYAGNSDDTYRKRWHSETKVADRFDDSSMYFVNRAQLVARRMLPTEAECTIAVFRNDYNYRESSNNSVRWEHGLTTTLVSRRENLRFKPYATFTTDQTDQDDGWNKTARLGLRGPLSDYMDIDGNVGYYEPESKKYHDFLYYLSLGHTPGPLTRQQVTWERFISEPGRELTDALRYQLLRRLGPDLTSSFLAEWDHYESRRGTQEERDEYKGGLRFDYVVAPKWDFSLTGLYTVLTDSDGSEAVEDWNELDIIFDAVFRCSPTFWLQLTYEYVDYNTRDPGASYYENLVIMKATKKF